MLKLCNVLSVLVGLSALLGSCAQYQTLSGGEKDTIPPQVLETLPKHEATKIVDPEIIFYFDEEIGLKDYRKNILITPNLSKPSAYRIKLRKDRLHIIIEDTLRDYTTYNINISGAVTDITEKNPVENVQLAFSTGENLDTASIRGKIMWAETYKEAENVSVLLVYAEDTLHFSKRRPVYSSKTNKEGVFGLENLSRGVYRLFAFEDNNNNITLDLEGEAHAFAEDSIRIHTKSSLMFDLALVEVDARLLELVRRSTQKQYCDILYNKEIEEYRITGPSAETFYTSLTPKRKGVRFYRSEDFASTEDSLLAYVWAKDEAENSLLDTIHILFGKESFKKRGAPESFTWNIGNVYEKVYHGDTLSVDFSFPVPIKDTYGSKIKYLFLPDSTEKIVDSTEIVWENNYKAFRWKIDSLEEMIEEIELNIEKGAFINIEEDSSEVKNLTFTKARERDFGRVSGKVSTEEKYYFLELLDEQGNVKRKTRNSETFQFSELAEGKYRLRVTKDRNNDGIWNKSNILKNKTAEETFMPDTILSVRRNWVLEDIEVLLK